MAIVEMKKMSLLAMKQDKQRLLKRLQRMGCVEVLMRDPDEQSVPNERGARHLDELNERIARMDLAIVRLNAFDPMKAGLLSLRPEADENQIASVVAARSELMDVVKRVEDIERTKGDLRAREARERAQLDQLAPWAELDLPLERVGKTRYAEILLLVVPSRAWGAFESGCEALPATVMERISQGRDGVCVCVAMHRSDAQAVDALIRAAGAARVLFDETQGTAALAIDQLNGKLARIDEVRNQLREEMGKLAEQLPLIRVLRDVEASERDRLSCAEKTLDTRAAFLLTGWAPAAREQEITQAMKKIAPVCEVEFADPLPDEKPPTLMHNGKMVTPFESIVKMFSLPDPNGVDPTFIMMPFWICFFGMMVSDAGYGLVLGAIASFVYCKLKGRGTIGQMAFILMLGGVSTLFWGAMYGGWFAESWLPPILFIPMDEPISMLGVCLGIGGVHLMVGLGMAAYMNIKRGKIWDAVFDQGFWYLLLIGLLLIFLAPPVGKVMAIAGALGILFTAGRGKKNLFSRLIGGFGSLYNVTGYVSDVLSYARLFGMGLATGVIGMVINTLAGMMWGSLVGKIFAVVVLIGGHTFNLVINALGAYVHACRLQFIEFFNKFYESGGRNFTPLSVNARYVDLKDET